MKVNQSPGIAAMHPHLGRLIGKRSVLCGGPVGLRYQGAPLIKSEYLRVDLSCNHFRLTGSVADFIQLALLADQPKISRESEVSVLNAVESRRVGNIVGVQDFFIKPANYLLVFGAPFRRESTRQHPERKCAKYKG